LGLISTPVDAALFTPNPTLSFSTTMQALS
jgi:hypothetical protein